MTELVLREPKDLADRQLAGDRRRRRFCEINDMRARVSSAVVFQREAQSRLIGWTQSQMISNDICYSRRNGFASLAGKQPYISDSSSTRLCVRNCGYL